MQSLTGEWLPCESKATALAFNVRYDLVSIGLTSGAVAVVRKSKGVWQTERTFNLSAFGINGDDTGAVSSLAWSPEARVLAVGFEKRGLALFSLYGCRLQCIMVTIYFYFSHF